MGVTLDIVHKDMSIPIPTNARLEKRTGVLEFKVGGGWLDEGCGRGCG